MAKPPKKFEYNLDAALTFREMRESEEHQKFNEAKSIYERELGKENRLKDQELSERYHLVDHLSAGKMIDFHQVMLRRNHLDQLKQDIVKQISIREESEEAKDIQQEALIQAVKEKKILEEDKSKKHEQWKQDVKKAEMAFLDEIATIRFVNRQRQQRDDDDATKRRRESQQ
jgi:flagellar FliJ protein